ncbi:lysosomal phospholipase A and acyltransferase-like [Arctopsyche grandis]|uniref:lysosomal phospholipase A and acyltransferase-like n=1 Tax=Arctopsyche grandis TaxID=121162 RepID=UPI00406D64BD
MLPKFSVCSFLFIFYCNIALTWGISPVILIPGDGGSQLEATLNKSTVVHYMCQKTSSGYFNIWLNLELLVPLVIDCWIDNMKLHYDNVSRMTSNTPGVTIKVPGWGNSEPVEWLDPSHASPGTYFKDITNALVSVGYVRNVSVRGAPYDFRKAPNENEGFFLRLRELVEETYTTNNKSKVTILTHSMGGTMALHFLHLQSAKWKTKYIERMITLAAPWGGAVKAIKVFAIGDNLGTFVLRESILREQQITAPSLAWLLPSPLFWKDAEVLVQTDKYNYTVKDLQKFFSDLDYINGWEMRKDTIQYTMDFSPPGVDLHCLYGSSVPTVERLVYKPGTWLDGYPTLAYGDGDGTVNTRSLEGCLHWTNNHRSRWTSKSGVKVVSHLALPKADHMSILSDVRVLEYLKNLLSQ